MELLYQILGWSCGGACTALAVFQFVGTIWCYFALKRKSVPELWGIDWLDILFRLEREFGVVFERADLEAIPVERRSRFTAGDLLNLAILKLQAQGRPVPAEAWTQVKTALSEALNVRSEGIKLESRLYQDLRMYPDLD